MIVDSSIQHSAIFASSHAATVVHDADAVLSYATLYLLACYSTPPPMRYHTGALECHARKLFGLKHDRELPVPLCSQHCLCIYITVVSRAKFLTEAVQGPHVASAIALFVLFVWSSGFGSTMLLI